MSEQLNMRETASRHKLLATVSAAALLGMLHCAEAQAGPDVDRPVIWFEFGGQVDRISGEPDPYAPPFTMVAADHGLPSTLGLHPNTKHSIGETAAISFQPEDSAWSISAAIRYGRSGGKKHTHKEIEIPGVYVTGFWTSLHPYGPNNQGPINRTADYSVKNHESHMIVDFQVGKDVGLGILSHDSISRLNFGVRFAQFTTKSNLTLFADPNPHLASKYFTAFQRSLPVIGYYQFYKAKPDIQRSFHGVGPSLSWAASVPLAGSDQGNAEITFDWGVNVAALFGRQKARIHHQTTGDRHKHDPFGPFHGAPKYTTDHYVNSDNVSRSRSIVVPNVGAMAGMSLQFPNAKISIGYRADFFFNAMDGGIDTRKNESRAFYGPYASISIGLGD